MAFDDDLLGFAGLVGIQGPLREVLELCRCRDRSRMRRPTRASELAVVTFSLVVAVAVAFFGVGVSIRTLPVLAPTAEIMKGFQTGKHWETYAAEFEALLDQRDIPGALDRTLFDPGPACLLCSEDKAEHCHRKLVAERFAQGWGDVEIRHL